MTRGQARESARDILEIIPLVMRAVAAELRAAGELPAPAHFGLLSVLSERPRTRTALDRVARAAEAHLSEVLAPLDLPARRRLRSGLGVLRSVFTKPGANGAA